MTKWLLSVVLIGALAGLVGWRIGAKGAQGGSDAPATARSGSSQGGSRTGGTGGGPGAGGGGSSRGGAAKVESATVRTISDAIEVVGIVESPYTVLVSPKTSGRIEYLVAREGDAVQPGEVLVRIDASELRAQVAQQLANVAQARSRLAEAELRRSPTAVGVQGAMRQEQASLESARADLLQVDRTAEAQIASAQAGIAQADAAVRSAEASIRNAEAEQKRDLATLTNVRSRLARAEQLHDKGYVSQQQLEDARNQVNVAESAANVSIGRVETARSSLDSAKAQRSSAAQNLEIAKRRAVADIAAARARVVQAQASLDLATANRSQNASFDQSILALRSAVDAANAQLSQAQTRLDDAVLRAPFAGRVTARTADPGTLASVGQPILTVQFLDWVYVTGSVSSERIGSIHLGQVAELQFDAHPGQTFRGAIASFDQAANPLSRQFEVRVKLQNSGQTVKPGMFGKMRLLTKSIPNAVVVPKEAVRTDDGVSTITVVDADGNADIRQVVLGVSDGAGVQIVQGVKGGEKVVTLSYQPPRQGQPVRTGGRPTAGEGSPKGSVSSRGSR